MNMNKVPGFTADASLYKTAQRYHSSTSLVLASGEPTVVSQMRAGGAQVGGMGQLGFLCSGNACICSGDADCNGMFSTVCGDGYAQCWVRGPGGQNVFCICSRA